MSALDRLLPALTVILNPEPSSPAAEQRSRFLKCRSFGPVQATITIKLFKRYSVLLSLPVSNSKPHKRVITPPSMLKVWVCPHGRFIHKMSTTLSAENSKTFLYKLDMNLKSQKLH